MMFVKGWTVTSMIHPRKSLLLSGTILSLAVSGSVSSQQISDVKDFLGPRFAPATEVAAPRLSAGAHATNAAEFLRHWNAVAVDASGLDHTPVAPGDPRVFGEQLGPARASRAMAIVHIAMFDAVNAISSDYRSYTQLAPFRRGTSMNAAIAQAARDTLVAMFPSQQSTVDQSLAAELAAMPNDRPKAYGVDLGHRAALAIFADAGSDTEG